MDESKTSNEVGLRAGMRVLGRVRKGWDGLHEYVVVEVSEAYIKLRNRESVSFWIPKSDFTCVEVLVGRRI